MKGLMREEWQHACERVLSGQVDPKRVGKRAAVATTAVEIVRLQRDKEIRKLVVAPVISDHSDDSPKITNGVLIRERPGASNCEHRFPPTDGKLVDAKVAGGVETVNVVEPWTDVSLTACSQRRCRPETRRQRPCAW